MTGQLSPNSRCGRLNQSAPATEGAGVHRPLREFLRRAELERLFHPLRLSNGVRTASYCSADGHVNPLYLVLAMQKSILDLGGHFHSGHAVRDIVPVSGGGFELRTDCGHRWQCGGKNIARACLLLGAAIAREETSQRRDIRS